MMRKMRFPMGASQLDKPPPPPRANADDTALSTVILRENHTARLKGNRVCNHYLVETMGEDY